MKKALPVAGPLLAALLAAAPASAPAQAFRSVSSQAAGEVVAAPAVPSPAPAPAPTTSTAPAFQSVSSLPATVPAAAPAAAPVPVPETAAPAPVPVSVPEATVAAVADPSAAPAAAPLPPARPFSSVSSYGPDGRPFVQGGAGPSLPGPGEPGDLRYAERIVVEKGNRRLLLLRGADVVATYPVRLGLNPYGHKQREGDFRTPEGTYYLSRRNPQSQFYLSLEVSYPNAADRERAREAGVRPGGLIMIHGQPNVPRKTPEYYARNDWTDGCIAVSNADMLDIWQRTRLGTTIEIRP
jgi:hypothetical protein